MVEVNIIFSGQAELILKNMSNINRDKILEWFTKIRKVSIGGGDILDYLKYAEVNNG